jgi:hypothetical protein
MANKIVVWRNGAYVEVSRKSARVHPVGVTSAKETGGKRKGRNLKRPVREDLSGNVLKQDLQRVSAIDPAATVTVAAGRRVKMISYIDPSKKRS